MTKLAPPRFVGQILGVWFLATAIGVNLAGQFSGNIDPENVATMPGQFLYLFWWGVIAGVVMLAADAADQASHGGCAMSAAVATAAGPQLTARAIVLVDRARGDSRGGQHVPRPVRRSHDLVVDSRRPSSRWPCSGFSAAGTSSRTTSCRRARPPAASIAAGVIFTIPALVILGYWTSFNYSWVLAIAGLGGVLGVLFSVPLRRCADRRAEPRVPGRKCAAEVLKAGENPAHGVKLLAELRRRSAALVKLLAASGARLIPDTARGSGLRRQGASRTSAPTFRRRCSASATSSGSTSASSSWPAASSSWNLAIPIYSTFFLDGNAELARADRGRERGRRRGRDLVDADSLPRRRRDADRRRLDAGLAAQVDLVRDSQRPRRDARRRGASRRAHRAGPADEAGADRRS